MEAAPLHDDLDGMPAGGRAVYVRAADGTRIRVAFWEGGRRTALIFPGRTEFVERYGHVVTRLQARDFSVAIVDWRGQGLSDRHEGRTDRGYVARFEDFQQDIAAMLAIPEVAAMPGPRTLFAHSMGGCIALRALDGGLDVQNAVFSAPMWGLPHAPKFASLLGVVDTLGQYVGMDTALVPGARGEYYPHYQPFAENRLTGDPVQYARMGAQLRAYPELGLGGATIHWAHEASVEMARWRDVPMPDMPMLVFVGSEEQVVDREAIEARVAMQPTARLEVLDGARHEVWMETPEIQEQVWHHTDSFLAETSVEIPA